MKRVYLLICEAFLMLSFLSACGIKNQAIIGGADEPTKIVIKCEADSGALPEYTYSGDDAKMGAIVEYFAEQETDSKSSETVFIPAYCILLEKEQSDGRIAVFGNFWSYWYSRNDDVLFCESGGEMPGVIYMKKNDTGEYTVDEFDRVGDGSDYSKDIKRICAGNRRLEKAFYKTVDAKKEPVLSARKDFIRQYVKDNGLNIKFYQDYGWEPVSIEKN